MATNPLKGKKFLVTCGPTWVPIDSVRVISNRSTGELGHCIVEELNEAGAKVTLLQGPVTHQMKIYSVDIFAFQFFSELRHLFEEQLRQKWDCVIHAAAVSDYQLLRAFPQKLNSAESELTLKLIPTEKLIRRVKQIDPKTFLVGFKLEEGSEKTLKEEARKLFAEAGCDLAVANIASEKYSGFILDKNMKSLAKAKSRIQMAKSLVKLLQEKI